MVNELEGGLPKKTLSHWTQVEAPFATESLKGRIEVDVCVVGAGIAGLTTAYLLLKEGHSVAVVDAGKVGGGETGRTTAQLSSVLEYRCFELENLHGVENARLIVESHAAAIDKVESIIATEAIACGWTRLPGYLFLSPTEDREFLDKEYAATQRAYRGETLLYERGPALPFDTGPCIVFPNQAQLRPMAYLKGLTNAIHSMGGKIYTESPVDQVEEDEDTMLTLGHDDFEIKSKSVVVATNSPVNDLVTIHTKEASYRSYVIAGEIAKGSMSPKLLWDTADPYHYIRVDEGIDKDYLIVGGEDHKTGQETQPEKHLHQLELWARSRFPQMGPIVARWSGQVQESIDGLAFLGHNPLDNQNVYVICGDCGNGTTHGTLGAMIIRDQICRRPNKWEQLYRPSRKTLRAAGTYVRENINAVCQMGDWLSNGEVQSVKEIVPGEGALVREGISLLASYRDESGVIHQCSAVCPHLGCIVKWNRFEKSWDCPCHGSRFDALGQVLSGPAVAPLTPMKCPHQEDFGDKATRSDPGRRSPSSSEIGSNV